MNRHDRRAEVALERKQAGLIRVAARKFAQREKVKAAKLKLKTLSSCEHANV